ncbi:hypothetical protein MATL_G00063350 [Megalops atlanticus]|uniref:RNA uridylyltransferase n=1 Tax=Megalops atlanticus TaxID=7932 RepID=A0A9D3Q7C8_MEGAT|nr:hypothetical protein MATL_G00063350 [Megalops atlanticus]
MEELGRPRSSKHGRGGKVADEAESWRSPRRGDGPDAGRVFSSKPERGSHGRRGAQAPLSSSPAGFGRAGQRAHGEFMEGFRKFPTFETHQAQEENWRERSVSLEAHGRKGAFRVGGEEESNRRQASKDPIHQTLSSPASHTTGSRRRVRERRKPPSERDENLDAPVIDEATLSEEQLVVLRHAEERIGRDDIFRLKKRARSSPSSKYRCALCDVLLDSVPAAQKHIREKWHKRRARDKREAVMLTEILPPTELQVGAVGVAIEQVLQERGLSEEDMRRRRVIVSSMEEVIRSVLPDCSLRLYGSSCTKFGFKDSDVNIDIQFPPNMHQPDVLLLVQESLSKSSLYSGLQADFHARVPVLVCKEKQSGLMCKVSAGNDNACLTTLYLSSLANQEPRLLPLVIAFRHWAQICHIDLPEEGGLPPYVMALMVIYFLQQRKNPVLPAYLGPWIKEFSINKLIDFRLVSVEDSHVLWEYCPALEEASPTANSFFRQGKEPLVFPADRWCSVPVGQLWVEMLRFYSLEFHMADHVISVRTNVSLSREAKDWPKKRIAIEDPFAVKRNVARTVNSQLMYEYILHCLKTTYKYFALPLSQHTPQQVNHRPDTQKRANQDKEGGLVAPKDTDLLQSGLSSLSMVSDVANGQAVQDEMGRTVRSRVDLLEDSDCVIEEEVLEGTDESERLLEEEESEDVDPTHLPYFPREVEPEGESLSDSEGGVPMVGRDSDDQDLQEDPPFQSNQSDEEEEEGCGRRHLDSFTTEEELYPLDTVSGEELLSEGEGPVDTPSSIGDDDTALQPSTSLPLAGDETAENGKPVDEGHAANHLRYEFNKQVFTRGKSHAIVCSLCKHDGHLKRDCPEDFKRVELDSLPPMTPKFLKILNEVCLQCYRDFSPDEIEERVREHILQDLEKHIRVQFEGAKLRLFGSSKNGFGFKQSDLDICMVLEGRDTAEGLDCIGIIDSLARDLRRHPGLRNILPITTAKVPIVKFFHVRTGLEGDISLYNTLALYNTRLLACYAAIDPRVRQLCYVMKVFAKVCDIGDASRGSLSSYAYTLMVLFFLQQRNPPVIPVLQEIYDGPKKPEVMVDGWNVYFFEDLEELPRRWPQYGTNKESIGELWLGLLRFYTEEFDFREHVICIRRKQPLTTFKKQWTSKYIVIEDPFDLNHNLGAGLSRRMTNFIMKAFINGRRVFGTPVKVFPSDYSSKMEYFFDPEVLTEGELAPNDRCCRVCGKIGHFMKDCPLRRKQRQRREQEDSTASRWRHDERERAEPQGPRPAERRRRQEEREAKERRCFLCGSHTHIKKECPQHRASAGTCRAESSSFSPSPSTPSHLKNFRERWGSPQQEEKKQVILGPEAGSLVSRRVPQPKPWPKRSSQH